VAGSAISIARGSTTWSATYLTILENSENSSLDANSFTSLGVLYGRPNGMTLKNCMSSGNSIDLGLAGNTGTFELTDCTFSGSLPNSNIASFGSGNVNNITPLSYSFQHFYTFHCPTNSLTITPWPTLTPTELDSPLANPIETDSLTISPTESIAGFHASRVIAETGGLRDSVRIAIALLAGSEHPEAENPAWI
jgi:hypothetical protein